jgi:transcription antitermination factor NusG
MINRKIEKTLDERVSKPQICKIDGGAMSVVQAPDPRWYVLQTNHHAENWAASNLRRAGYQTFLPLIREMRRDPVLRTMSRKVDVPCFTGYLFVNFCATTDPWRWPILKAEGVKRIFCTMSDRPIPVPRGQVELLMQEADARSVVQTELPPFAAGSELIVTAGPFADRHGICQWSSEKRTRLRAAQ